MMEFIKNISPIEIVLIVLVLFVLFGSKFLLGLANRSGKAVKEVKKAFKGATDDGDK